MSTLAIVLGIGFLTGVLTFSTGLNSTFDSIIKGSTPDAVVRPDGHRALRAVRHRLHDGRRRRRTSSGWPRCPRWPRPTAASTGSACTCSTRTASWSAVAAPRRSASTTPTPPTCSTSRRWSSSPATGPTAPTEVVLDTGAAEKAGYEIGDEVTVLAPVRRLDRHRAHDADHGRHRRVQRRRHRGRDAARVLDRGRAAALPGRAGRLHVRRRSPPRPASPRPSSRTPRARCCRRATRRSRATRSPTSRSRRSREFTDVITQFLMAFAVIAILVGGFIIANTFNILVAQRVRELALLRALGASTKQVRRSVLVEAALMAVLGATLGILLGLGLARGLASLFSSFGLEISSSALDPHHHDRRPRVRRGPRRDPRVGVPARRAGPRAPRRSRPCATTPAPPAEGSLRRRAIIGGAGRARRRRAGVPRPDGPAGSRRGLDRRRRRAVGAHRRGAQPGARSSRAAGLPPDLHEGLRHHRPARRREHAAQPAAYRRHRVGPDDRARGRVGRRHPRRVDEQDDRRARRRAGGVRLPGAVGQLPVLRRPASATRWSRSTGSGC